MTLCSLLQGGVSGKEYTCQCRRRGFDHCVRKIPWSGKWQPTLVFLPGESQGQRSLVDYCLWVAESQKWLSTRVHWWNYVGQIRDLIIVGKRNVSSIQTIVITAYWYCFCCSYDTLASWATNLKTSIREANKMLWLSVALIVLFAALMSFFTGRFFQKSVDAAPTQDADPWMSLEHILWPFTRLRHNGPPPVWLQHILMCVSWFLKFQYLNFVH